MKRKTINRIAAAKSMRKCSDLLRENDERSRSWVEFELRWWSSGWSENILKCATTSIAGCSLWWVAFVGWVWLIEWMNMARCHGTWWPGVSSVIQVKIVFAFLLRSRGVGTGGTGWTFIGVLTTRIVAHQRRLGFNLNANYRLDWHLSTWYRHWMWR